MNHWLTQIYDTLYTPPELDELQTEISAAHQLLRETLQKPEKELVLLIIDDYAAIADELSIDSFFHGFKLGLELAFELKRYDGHLHGDDANEDVRRSIRSEGGES